MRDIALCVIHRDIWYPREQQEPLFRSSCVLRVADLPARIDALKKAGVKLRNQMETGPAGRQIQIEDPDGNPIELFEAAQ